MVTTLNNIFHILKINFSEHHFSSIKEYKTSYQNKLNYPLLFLFPLSFTLLPIILSAAFHANFAKISVIQKKVVKKLLQNRNILPIPLLFTKNQKYSSYKNFLDLANVYLFTKLNTNNTTIKLHTFMK
jgi:hypothetical protein